MIVQCPHCDKEVAVNGLGRRPLNMPVINICDALRDSSTATLAAKKLGCSRGYIYKILKANNLKIADVREKV